MNAMLREHDEVFVLSNDAIEAQLIHMRDGLQELRASHTLLHARIDKTTEKLEAANASLFARIEAVDTRLSARIDASENRLSAQIDKTNERIDQLDVKLSGQIEQLDVKLSAQIEKTNDRIEQLDVKLSAQIEKTNDRIDQLDGNLSGQIEKTNDKLDTFKKEMFERFDRHSAEIKDLANGIKWIHVSTKVVLAILGLCATIAVVVNALKTLGWLGLP